METETARLDVGDYTVKGYEDVFSVERKSINDLAKSVGADRQRFEAEIQRAQRLAHFAVVIEGTEADVITNDYFSMIHPNAVLGTVGKWPLKYSQLEFIWAGDREGAKQEALRKLDKWYIY